jgi:hypothetical protein
VNDPSLPVEIFAGPYGFLAVIFVCVFWSLREWRRGRELDVASYRKRAEEAESRYEAEEQKNQTEVTLLTTKIDNLQSEMRAIREQHFRDVESITSKYYAARQILLASGVPHDQIP